MYEKQSAIIQMSHKLEQNIKKCVRQGCLPLPILFNIYVEQSINGIKEIIIILK